MHIDLEIRYHAYTCTTLTQQVVITGFIKLENLANSYSFFFFFCCTWSLLLLRRLSLVAVSGGYSLLWCEGFSLWWLLLLWNTGSRAPAQKLWHRDLAAQQHVESSRARDQSHVPCIGRQILIHCAIREVLDILLMYIFNIAQII